VLYVNTSVEIWDPYGGADDKHPSERTLYRRHMNLRRMIARWSEPGPTAVLEHGANPGLISHFTKQALLDIARQALTDKKFSGAQAEQVAHHAKAQEFNHLAHQLGVRSFIAARHDTQITDQPKQVNGSVSHYLERRGLPAKGTTTAEWAQGTHEKQLPPSPSSTRTAQEPDLPGAHGHEHVRGELGAAGPPYRRYGRPPR
jgi:homospermidine synthase